MRITSFKKAVSLSILLIGLLLAINPAGFAEEQNEDAIFNDKALLDGYSQKYTEESQDIILEIIQDDTLSPYKTAAAVRVFREKFAANILRNEKKMAVKALIRRLNRSDSSFVQVEIMHTLCFLDRYKYFDSLAPSLIQKLGHYNDTVSEMAFTAIDHIIKLGRNRTREARIIFSNIRRHLLVNRKKLSRIKEADPKLKREFELLRWSIKILGKQQLKKLPSEVINLL